MRINIIRPRLWLLATWIVCAGSLLFSASPPIVEGSQRVATLDAYRSVESTVSISSPAHGAGDPVRILVDEPVLDDQDFHGKDSSTSWDFEDAQHDVPVVFFHSARPATVIHPAHFESTSRVEPRLLRYARLLF